MDSKVIIAIAVVAVVAVAGTATFFLLNNDKDSVDYDGSAFNVISRVNSEGSGLYIKKSVANTDGPVPVRISNSTPFFGDGFTLSESNKAAWGGLILGDPGVSSIQHTQLASIAKSVGLKFVQYTTEVGSLQDDTLYYVTNLANYGAITGSTDIQGGIIWEPQFQRVVQEDASYTTLALTNDLFDGHTCCIIAANHNWLKNNSGDAVKFLAGYIKAVNYIVDAKRNGGEAYTDVINIAKSSTTGLDDEEVAAALANIDYLYADSSDGSLEQLTKDIENLAGSLKDIGAITKDYGSGSAFAKAFVDDTYIKDAVAGKASKEGTSSVKVAVIGGDIHQLAIHVAIAKEYFKEYGLTVNLSTGSNGGDIATLLDSKDVDIGFLGAPPATIKTINGEHIKV